MHFRRDFFLSKTIGSAFKYVFSDDLISQPNLCQSLWDDDFNMIKSYAYYRHRVSEQFLEADVEFCLYGQS